MGIELIYADKDFCEQGIVTDFDSFEAVISLEANEEDNDFHLALSEKIWKRMKISPGEYVYIPNTQWGGMVGEVRHSGQDGTVDIYGVCWRGLLCRKIICPPEGETHLVFKKVEANEAVRQLVGEWNSALFAVTDQTSEILCTSTVRYRNLLESLDYVLKRANARLCLTFADKKVHLSAAETNDRSSDMEFSPEYDARVVCTASCEKANHIIALGGGQLLERTVLELWRLPDGTITQDKTAQGVPSESEYQTLLYDFSAVEDEEQLLEYAKRRLRTAAASNSMEIELYGGETELELTDLVSARDTLTSQSKVLRVSSKEIRISESGVSVTYKLSEREG